MQFCKLLIFLIFLFGNQVFSAEQKAEQKNISTKGIYCDLNLPHPASFIMNQFNKQELAENKIPFKLLFGDGEWVVKTYSDHGFIKFYIDMQSGKITNYKKYSLQHAFDFYKATAWDKSSKSLSDVVNALEKSGYLNIEFVVWAGKNFKAHVCKDHRWQDVLINKEKGSIVSNIAKPSLEIQ